MINKKNLKDIILAGIDREIVLFEDAIDIENIETEYVNEYKFNSDEAKEFMDKNFSDRQKLDAKLRDKNILGLSNFDFYGGKVFINFEKGTYKTYLATLEPKYRDYIEKGNFFIVPLFVLNVVVTKDNKIVISKSDKNKSGLVGGFISDRDAIAEKINFLNCSFTKINKDVGNLYIHEPKLLGIFKSDCCYFVIKYNMDLSSKEIEELQNMDNNTVETGNNIVFIKNREEDVGDAIENQSFTNETRTAFKFYIKNVFYNYKYVNIKIK
ncbi:hypothetical protein FACS1894152_3620 [Bacilli bacterium]|nr:hypothetical protein FACS1894152_3620 [Bacilli bacterium]